MSRADREKWDRRYREGAYQSRPQPSPAFRVAPGDLAELAAALQVEELDEGLFEDPDGRTAALARPAAPKTTANVDAPGTEAIKCAVGRPPALGQVAQSVEQ